MNIEKNEYETTTHSFYKPTSVKEKAVIDRTKFTKNNFDLKEDPTVRFESTTQSQMNETKDLFIKTKSL